MKVDIIPKYDMSRRCRGSKPHKKSDDSGRLELLDKVGDKWIDIIIKVSLEKLTCSMRQKRRSIWSTELISQLAFPLIYNGSVPFSRTRLKMEVWRKWVKERRSVRQPIKTRRVCRSVQTERYERKGNNRREGRNVFLRSLPHLPSCSKS